MSLTIIFKHVTSITWKDKGNYNLHANTNFSILTWKYYHWSFTDKGYKCWNCLPNFMMGVPSPEGPQQLRKVAHNYLLKDN